MVVRDRLVASQPRAFSWLLHHWGDTTAGADLWTITVGDAQLTVVPLAPGGLEATTETYRPQFVHPTRDLTPEDADIGMLSLTTQPVTEATFLIPLLVGDSGTSPPSVLQIDGENCQAVRVGETVVAFNTGAGDMVVPTPWGKSVRSKAPVLVARLRAGERQVVSP